MWETLGEVAKNIAPLGVIFGVIGSVLGAVYGVYRLRKAIRSAIAFFLRLIRLVETANTNSEDASEKAGTASANATAAVANTEETSESVLLLARVVGEQGAQIDRMAAQNDKWFSAYTAALAQNARLQRALGETHGRTPERQPDEEEPSGDTGAYTTGRQHLQPTSDREFYQ